VEILQWIIDFFYNISTDTLIIFLIILIALFFLVREIIAWYYKINKIIALLTEQNSLLKEIVKKK